MASLLHPERSWGVLISLYAGAVVPTLLKLPGRLPASFPKGFSGVVHLIGHLKSILEPKSIPEGDQMIAHLRSTLSITAAALPILARMDDVTQQMLTKVSPGLLQLTVPDADLSIWIEWNGSTLRSDWGKPSQQPDTILCFRDMKTAYLAFSKQLDELAAIGNGDLVLTGMIPLADGLNGVMDRVAHYLK